MVKTWMILVSSWLCACTTHFSGMEQDAGDIAGASSVGSQDSTQPTLVAMPTGGSSFGSTTTSTMPAIAGTSSTGGQSSVGGSSATGGGSSVAGSTPTGGAQASTGGASSVSASSTGGISTIAPSTYVGVSNSVPQTTVTYVIRYTIENVKEMWPNFRLAYYNRDNKAATYHTDSCLDFNNGKGMECRITVNQALSWELSVCIGDSCQYTLPRFDMDKQTCTISSGIRVFRTQGAGLIEIDSGFVKTPEGACNLIIQPGGLAQTNTQDADGDGVIDVNDELPKNPSVHPRITSTDREICYNDLDEDQDGQFDNGDCANVVPPASTGSSASLRSEVHWLLPNQTGVTFASTDAELVQVTPVYQSWSCEVASVADFVTGNYIQGIRCVVERDPTKEFEYYARVGDQYLTGYTCSTPTTCLSHAFRDYVTVGSLPYASLDDGRASGFTRKIELRYISSGDTVHAVVPMQ